MDNINNTFIMEDGTRASRQGTVKGSKWGPIGQTISIKQNLQPIQH